MKRAIIVLSVVLMLSACGGGRDRQTIEVALIGKAETPYWNDTKLGAEAAGRDLGVSVKFLAPPKPDPAWQIRKIEGLISNSIDGIAFAASDPKSIAPSIVKAMQLKIPCVAMDTDVAKSRHAYIGTSNYRAGKQAGDELISLIGNKGKIAIIADSTDNHDSLQRAQGFKDALAEYADVELAATLEKEDGIILESDAEALLKSHPDLDGVLCTSGSTGVAAAKVVQKAGKAGSLKIACIGESTEVMTFVRDKVIQIAVARKPYRMGYLSVLVLSNMIRAGVDKSLMIMPKSEMVDTGTALVTPTNIGMYREILMNVGIDVEF